MLLSSQPVFTPTSLYGAKLWLDATQQATGAVATWTDLTGNANATGISTAQPVCTANTINGLNAVVFDGVNDLLTVSGRNSTVSRLLPFTIVIVVKFSAIPSSTLIGSSLSASDRISIQHDGGTDLSSATYNGTTFTPSSAVFSDTTSPHIVVMTNSSNNEVQQYIDSVLSTGASTPSTSATAAFNIGATAGGASFFTGAIGEIIIYNRQLFTNELLALNNYLSNKWGAAFSPSLTTLQRILLQQWNVPSFTNVSNNPFSAIIDPVSSPLSIVPPDNVVYIPTSTMADTGRGVNTLVSSDVKLQSFIGTFTSDNVIANSIFFLGANAPLSMGSNSSIDDIFANGGCFIGVFQQNLFDPPFPTQIDIFNKTQTIGCIQNQDTPSQTASLAFTKTFSGTNGNWRTTNRDIVITSDPDTGIASGGSIIAITYNASNVVNNPIMYVNSLTPKAVTRTSTPVGTASSDAASTLYLGNDSTGTNNASGAGGSFIFLNSIPNTAQLTAVFNYLSSIYGITLT